MIPHQPSGSTQRLASRLADAFARGRPPRPSPALDAFLSGPVDELYAVLDAFQRFAAAGTERTQNLADAYLYLLERRLESLRFDIEANYDQAKEAVAAFQQTVVQYVRDGRICGGALFAIGRALRAAKLKPIPELIDASDDQLGNISEEEALSLPREGERVLNSLVEQAGDDPFAITEAMSESGFVLPPAATAAAASLFVSQGARVAEEAAALMMLDANAETRRAVAVALRAHAPRLSPTSLRRLVMTRNWLPERDHHLVDQIVRTAREAGIQIPPLDPRHGATIYASSLDGTGTQGLMIVTPAGKQQRLSSLMVKQRKGIHDVWCGEEQAKGEIRSSMRFAMREVDLKRVSREYLDLTVEHYLAVGRSAGNIPSPALLQLAEIAGGAWQPRLIDWQNGLAALIDAVPAAQRSEAAMAGTLATSFAWGEVGAFESWYEGDQEVADLVGRTKTRSAGKLAPYLLHTIIRKRAAKWAEHFFWTALWLRHLAPEADPRWSNFAILARAIADGRNVADIPIMQDIAARTAVALASAPTRAGAIRPR